MKRAVVARIFVLEGKYTRYIFGKTDIGYHKIDSQQKKAQ